MKTPRLQSGVLSADETSKQHETAVERFDIRREILQIALRQALHLRRHDGVVAAEVRVVAADLILAQRPVDIARMLACEPRILAAHRLVEPGAVAGRAVVAVGQRLAVAHIGRVRRADRHADERRCRAC
jgi:hypothetical protein